MQRTANHNTVVATLYEKKKKKDSFYIFSYWNLHLICRYEDLRNRYAEVNDILDA